MCCWYGFSNKRSFINVTLLYLCLFWGIIEIWFLVGTRNTLLSRRQRIDMRRGFSCYHVAFCDLLRLIKRVCFMVWIYTIARAHMSYWSIHKAFWWHVRVIEPPNTATRRPWDGNINVSTNKCLSHISTKLA